MAERFKFTQQKIEKLPLPDKGRTEYYDDEEKKLVCRVSSSGNKSFLVIKKNTAGSTQRVTLGRFPDMSVGQARAATRQALSEIAQGVNPIEERRKQRYRAMSLQALLDAYLNDKKDLRPATIRDYKDKVKNGFGDWIDKPINEITREMVKARRNKLTTGIDNKMRVLRLLMNYAVKTLQAIEHNPVDIITDGKLWSEQKRRTRLIPSDNLPDWYKAVLELDNEKAKVYLLLLLHTGLRDEDVRYLKWADVDFNNDCFIARDTKNHSDFTAYIAPQIKPFLRRLHSMTGNNVYCFPGDNKDGVMGIPRKPIQQVIKKTGIEFSSHDLKRTFITISEAAMIPFNLSRTLANHKTTSDITGGYIHTEAKTRKEATFKIADLIQQYATPEQDNIIPMKKAKGA